DIASATGLVGQDTVANLGWKRPEPEDVRVALVSASSSEVLALESTIKPGRFGTRRRAVSVLWSISDHGSSSWATTRLELQCGPLSTRGELALCLAFDGGTTRFFEVNPVTRRLRALVSVKGRFFRSGDEGNFGWIAGSSTLGSVLLRPAGRAAVGVDARDGSHADGLAITDRMVGAVFSNGYGSIVRLYDREQIGAR